MGSYFDQEEEFSERRKEPRWNIPVPVRVKGTLADGTAFEEEAVTADVSPSGMCVLLSLQPNHSQPTIMLTLAGLILTLGVTVGEFFWRRGTRRRMLAISTAVAALQTARHQAEVRIPGGAARERCPLRTLFMKHFLHL